MKQRKPKQWLTFHFLRRNWKSEFLQPSDLAKLSSTSTQSMSGVLIPDDQKPKDISHLRPLQTFTVCFQNKLEQIFGNNGAGSGTSDDGQGFVSRTTKLKFLADTNEHFFFFRDASTSTSQLMKKTPFCCRRLRRRRQRLLLSSYSQPSKLESRAAAKAWRQPAFISCLRRVREVEREREISSRERKCKKAKGKTRVRVVR